MSADALGLLSTALGLQRSAPASMTREPTAAPAGAHRAARSAARQAGFQPIEQPEKPPFDFLADLVLVAALIPAAPVRAAFPGIPVLSLGGRAPLLAWFSHVRESCYRDAAGRVRCTRQEGEGDYTELTLMLLLRNGAFFVPHIEASSALSQRLAHAYYGMPKALVPAAFGEHKRRLAVRVAQSRLEGYRLRGTAPLTVLARAILPHWTWQACFPSSGHVRAHLPWVERVVCIRIHQARLAPQPPWLPDPIEPLSLGVLLEGARMRLLPPEQGPVAERIGHGSHVAWREP